MRRIAAFVTIATLAAACSTASSANSSPNQKPIELTVYAAASLKGVLEAVRTAYERAVPDATITLATDASSTLRTQIEQGAPADVFLSADESNPTKLVDAGLADGAAVAFADNTLVVIVPVANPAAITTPADLVRTGTRIIAAGAHVPIAEYTTMAVTNLGRLPGYPADFAAAYDTNVVSKEDNVKAVVAKIELGEGDAAVVYATDARVSTKVATIDIPPDANVRATYQGVVLRTSGHPAAGHTFLSWLAGPDGQAVLAGFGFLPPS